MALLIMTLLYDTGESALPRRLWLLLLTHAVGLLENHDVIFNDRQISTMMNCLAQLEISHKHDIYLKDVKSEDLSTIRLSLARSMARAMMYIK
jgi:hypothetical protein